MEALVELVLDPSGPVLEGVAGADCLGILAILAALLPRPGELLAQLVECVLVNNVCCGILGLLDVGLVPLATEATLGMSTGALHWCHSTRAGLELAYWI